MNPSSNFTQEQLALIKESFFFHIDLETVNTPTYCPPLCEGSPKGLVPAERLLPLMRSLGLAPTVDDDKVYRSKYGRGHVEGSNLYNFDEVCSIITDYLSIDRSEKDEYLNSVFTYCGPTNNFITVGSMRRVFCNSALGEKIDDADFDQLLRDVNIQTGDDVLVSKEMFWKLMSPPDTLI